MKITYDNPNELENIQKIVEEYPYTCCFDPPDEDRTYAITFKVTNSALASHVLLGLLHNKLEDFDIGIDVQSIEFNPNLLSREEIKMKLMEAVDNLL